MSRSLQTMRHAENQIHQIVAGFRVIVLTREQR
jgi:hypothetical protein